MKRKRLILKVFIILLILLSIYPISYGAEYINPKDNVYVVIINKLTLIDIENMPNLNRIIDEGSIGLMNVRGLNGYKGAESFITINASAKAYANNESSQFYNLDDSYKEIYENRMFPLDKNYAIGNIQIGRLYNQNENNNYSPHLGALGDSLHNAGFKTAVFGNSDTDETQVRTAALIPMDAAGLIDYGNVDNILIEDGEYPYGIKTDYDKILNEIETLNSKASLILIDTGDLNRLGNYSSILSKDVFDEKRKLILEDIDEFIDNLMGNLDKENSLLMILSPNKGEERVDDNNLSPIIIWGKDIDKGIITSGTTNREGIISNLDISPTISEFLNTSKENMVGNSIKSIEKEDSFSYINSINKRINTTSKIRSKTLLIYSIISIIIMLVVIFIFYLNIKTNNGMGKLFNTLLLLLYSTPMAFILTSAFNINNIYKFIIIMAIIIGGFAFISNASNNKNIITLISYGYFFVIITDILFNGAITRFSVLSHDPIIGARYFGLGNEMVGVFLAATALVAGLLFKKYNNKFIPIVIMFLSVVIVGHPKLGANVGGTISLLIGAIYFTLEMMKKQLNFKNIVLIAVLTGLVIMILGYIDIALNQNPTHLGKTLILLNEKGASIAKNIINRKLLMNIKLVGGSIWTKVLFINILVQTFISYLYKDKIQILINSNLGKGILSGIVGSIVGFLLNDSGIILSGISMNIITIYLLFNIINFEEIFKQEVE